MHTRQHLSSGYRLNRHVPRPYWLWPAIALWMLAVVLGWRAVTNYGFDGGWRPAAETPVHWPTGAALTLAPGYPTVVFFMHPKCPCTRASLAELERLWVLRDTREASRAPRLVFVATVPQDATADWLNTDCLERAHQFSDATIFIDHDGREAERFGATTSGTVMWFAADGRRLYAGGITASRGHEGDNAGLDDLTALLQGRPSSARGMPALGCRLCPPSAESSSNSLAGGQTPRLP